MNRTVHRPVVGIDPSFTATGLCVDGELEKHSFGSVEKGDRLGELDRLNKVWYWAQDFPPATSELVAIEGYSYGSKYYAHQSGELGGTIKLQMGIRRIPFLEVPPSTLKQYATGKGNAGKPDMRVAMLKRFDQDEKNDNKVDAFWLYAIAMEYLGRPLVKMPQANREALSNLRVYGHIG